jgi:hypothetical protein
LIGIIALADIAQHVQRCIGNDLPARLAVSNVLAAIAGREVPSTSPPAVPE